MSLIRHTHDGGKFLALRTCRDDHDPTVGIIVYLIHWNDCARLKFDHIHLLHYFNIGFHTASLNDDFLAKTLQNF